jgi:DNA-binding CsgD family transcriptional regulator
MTATDALSLGREAFERQAWAEACSLLSTADSEESLDPEDLECLATVAYLVGNDAAWSEVWGRAHQQFRDRGDAAGAVRCAFWLAFGFMNTGEMARAGGWLARAQRVIDERQLDCAECGYLLLPAAIESCDGDPATSYAAFSRAAEIGARFGDPDLVALARHGQGRALIRLGEATKGMALLDEVLVAVTAGELSPIVTGDIYCGVIEACHETFDMRRAQEWTSALTRWCESQPDVVPFRGQCLVYRAAIMQLRGEWSEALEEAVHACKRLSEPVPHPAAGAAYYQRAEIHRLRGEFAEAEESYRQADTYGRDAQPGLAQLRLAQGQTDVAAASIRRVLDEAHDLLTRSSVLGASVEIMLAASDLAAARAAADELSDIAHEFGSPFLLATSAHMTGAVLFVERDYRAAINTLRKAYGAWRELEAPHEAARTRVLIGLVCRQLGDPDTAALEFQAARHTFEGLGAAPDLVRLAKLSQTAPEDAAGLTPRELDILRLVATGKTNRAIGDELVISEKTVARHVSNIFAKLELSSRAAATAYAYEHDLI